MKKLFILFVTIAFLPAFADNLVSQNLIDGCDANNLNAINNVANMVPVFVINTYTCSAGYFLPANTLGCKPCPTDYTCNGGTFDFNPREAQGLTKKEILSTSTQYTCSINFLNSVNDVSNMIPIFRPNTMTITWDDGVGNSESTTCVYDDVITLPPPPPTRVGYTFNGWKVSDNNNE